MEKMTLTMGTTEIIAQPTGVFGTQTYSFEHELLYLRAGAFAASHLDVNSRPGGYVSSLEFERQVWQRFVLVLGAAKSMVFAIPPNTDDLRWYQRKASGQDPIPYMDINGYDASHERSWGVSPDASIQIHDVKIGYSIVPGPGMMLIGLTYAGMTKIVW